ncbi:MAG TPA: hypothetical protein VMB71_15885, partial [Acetobacteraceae bacterium]|nr:hypothetical protein [Acetobacteraceae bacterium]
GSAFLRQRTMAQRRLGASSTKSRGSRAKQGSISFLKKEKNFYPLRLAPEFACLGWLFEAIDKSLLLLFFRKEVLFYVFSFSPYLGSYQKRTAFL